MIPGEVLLEKVQNLRDLGGIPAGDGHRVAPGRIYRSASLHEMTAADRAALEARRIRTVVDLRSSWEQGHQGYTWPYGRKVAAPMAGDDSVAAIYRSFIEGTLSEAAMDNWWDTVGAFAAPAEYRGSVGAVFAALLDATPGEATLFHCAGGKDRTGVVAALILHALGAPREAILADFLATNDALATPQRLEELAERLNRGLDRPISRQALFAISGVKPEWLDMLFARLEREFGSVDAYLRDALGLTPTDLAALREGYLEPTTS